MTIPDRLSTQDHATTIECLKSSLCLLTETNRTSITKVETNAPKYVRNKARQVVNNEKKMLITNQCNENSEMMVAIHVR